MPDPAFFLPLHAIISHIHTHGGGVLKRVRDFLAGHSAARNLLVLLLTLGITVAIAELLSHVNDDNNPFAMALFMTSVVIIARWTDGYGWGIFTALIGTFCVNYMFTYPFWEFSMDYSGYPLTFAVMLIVSVLISTLTTQVKQQEKLKYEIEKEKMHANLLRAIAHDLRTPLTAIIGASSVIQEQALSPADQVRMAEGIRKDAQWLVRVTENLLSVTRFSSDVALKKEGEVLEEIIESAIRKYHRIPDALPVEADTLSDILLVPMDAMLIEQVLINLFDNVNDHAEGASGIWIHLKQRSDRISISVEDDGCGISPAQLPRILNGTCSPARAVTDGRRSMGIGLSVCKSIIEAHGGCLTAGRSRHGGAMFEFTLPYGEEDHDE